ncbi:MAG TPA: NADPH-dependent oxidoreductase [Bacteroidetes bacterium]|nr:NADPH-dependent oxidoreductase [Bacteroidota bacterium]
MFSFAYAEQSQKYFQKLTTNNKTIIILGSSRSDGDTRAVAGFLLKNSAAAMIDLNDYNIGYFDYGNKNADDDFIPLMRKIIPRYERIIFATPVYWYSMSAVMKTFFDRISDLLKWEKDLGRELRGKAMAVVSCSGSDDLIDGFDMPFRESADYLGMEYLGHAHTWVKEGKISEKGKQRMMELFK